jgi:hypothetical protein
MAGVTDPRFDARDRPLNVGQQGAAGGGQDHPPRPPLEELDADLGLERANARTERRLANMQDRARTSNGTQSGNLEERVQVTEQHAETSGD